LVRLTRNQQLLFDLAFSLKKITLPGFRRAVTEATALEASDLPDWFKV